MAGRTSSAETSTWEGVGSGTQEGEEAEEGRVGWSGGGMEWDLKAGLAGLRIWLSFFSS